MAQGIFHICIIPVGLNYRQTNIYDDNHSRCTMLSFIEHLPEM